MLRSSCCCAARCCFDAKAAGGMHMKMCRKARANAGQVNSTSKVSMSCFFHSAEYCFQFGEYVVKLTEKEQIDPNKAFLLRRRGVQENLFSTSYGRIG